MSVPNAIMQFTQILRNKLSVPFNSKHQLLLRENGGFSAKPPVIPAGIVVSAEELEAQLGLSESFSEVFDSWLRFSRRSGYNDDAIPEELEAWVYLPEEDLIRCTLNTESVVGFISPERYDQYTLETVLSSVDKDDDFIGVVIAHATDELGRNHILTAMRSGMGIAPLVIDKNPTGHNTRHYNVAAVFEGLTWINGTLATGPGPNGGNGGWSDIPDGVRLKVTRKGDLITVETSQFGESEYFAPATTLIDLASDPELAVFRGPQRFGYVACSQKYATWKVLQRPSQLSPVYDLNEGKYYQYNGNEWVAETKSITDLVAEDILTPGWMHLNLATGRYFFLTPDLELIEV